MDIGKLEQETIKPSISAANSIFLAGFGDHGSATNFTFDKIISAFN
ncbi:MAG: hypothetical protein ACJAVI_005374 [Candidatus Azotimanducaceae bacterium]|jgi:hypothetical protein